MLTFRGLSDYNLFFTAFFRSKKGMRLQMFMIVAGIRGILLVELKVLCLCYVRSTNQAGMLFSEHFKTTWLPTAV